MRFVDEYRSEADVRKVADSVRALVTRPWTLMEICGGQTHTLIKYGLDRMLPDLVSLVHGPGCPVCVTPLELIDEATIPPRLRALAGDRSDGADRAAGSAAAPRPAPAVPPRIGVWSARRPDGPACAHWEPMPPDAAAVARAMYDTLRRLDTLGLDRLIVGRVPVGPEWDAVRDRLERAAASF